MSSAALGCRACKTPQDLFPFTMAFQPIIDLQEQRIDSHEALVRGPDGQGAAWVLDQVDEQNRYAFDQACRGKAIELAARLGVDCWLNINFLPAAVYEPKACLRATLDAARRSGFRLDRLTFEIVESEQIADERHLLNIIPEYRRHGFKIALDDFGTGYSGLARLAALKPDIVKLDRVIVANCHQDHTRLAIIASMLGLGAQLGVKVVVEGVETADELSALRDIGARYIQGYYFAKPVFEGLARVDAMFGTGVGGGRTA